MWITFRAYDDPVWGGFNSFFLFFLLFNSINCANYLILVSLLLKIEKDEKITRVSVEVSMRSQRLPFASSAVQADGFRWLVMAGYGWLYLAAFERTHHDRKKPLHLYMQLLRCADSAPCKRTCRRILFYLRKIRATFDLAGSDPILPTNGGVAMCSIRVLLIEINAVYALSRVADQSQIQYLLVSSVGLEAVYSCACTPAAPYSGRSTWFIAVSVGEFCESGFLL
ncbi:hypothetical protein F5877DRAFT_69672 [Lentinula edodes]|nr:hypothetical protein F5877DRAFT_69672 [Lentinula edodes]